jgi:hypothetical protein
MKRKLENVVSDAQHNTTIHNHSKNWAPEIILAGLFVLGVSWLGYQFILSGLAELGIANPKAVFFLIVFGGLFVIAIAWIISWLFNYSANQAHVRRLELEQERRELLAIQHRLQQSVVADSRALDPQTKRRNALVVTLMADALLSGKNNFSYRKAGAYVLTGEQKPVGKDSKVVAEALDWLRDSAAVKGNQLTGKYTSIGDVQRDLHAPVLVDFSRLSVPTTTTTAGDRAK